MHAPLCPAFMNSAGLQLQPYTGVTVRTRSYTIQISVQWPWGDGLKGERQLTARIDMFHAVGVQHRRSFLEGFFSLEGLLAC